MTAVASNLVSNAPFTDAARMTSRSRGTSSDTTGRFDQVMQKSAQTREQTQAQSEKNTGKTDENDQDQAVDQVDEQAQQTDDQQDLQGDVEQNDDELATDEMEAAQGGVVAESQNQVVNQNVDNSAYSTQTTATDHVAATDSPLLEAAQQQNPQQGDTSQKHAKDVADAMLRMLGIANGQGAGQSQQATFTLTDTISPVLQTSSTSDQQANQQLQLPNTQSSQESDAANVSRVSRALSNAVNQKGGTITIRMMPPELGQVKVDIQMQGGKVSASFQTEHQSVQTLMSRELSQLRQALERQGLTVERLEVTHRPANSSNANASGQDQQQQSPSDGRSRGQYARQDSGNQESSETTNNSESQNFATQLDSQL
ncbi:MAG: flagellar hook-length control protein FliK [Phycisphaeraceae bacterium JB051]